MNAGRKGSPIASRVKGGRVLELCDLELRGRRYPEFRIKNKTFTKRLTRPSKLDHQTEILQVRQVRIPHLTI